MRRLLIAFVLASPVVGSAQAPTTPPAPDARTLGWQVRGDDGAGDPAKLVFVEMKPGWHVTTGPFSGVLFHPGMTGTGNYTARMSVFFFPPKSAHHEGYGMLLGGKDLAGAGQQYTYFLLRNDGKFLIKRRVGTTSTDVVPWTASEAIKVWKVGDQNVLNALRVEAASDSVRFRVNDVVVATRARADVPADGVVGIRANHFIDLHISELSVRNLDK